ncbi:hypothetical protein [Xylanimonas ulmi]|uniref:PKD domain-containing protein n=1 Tax=Xylanimonas ulmi TaxID=228973 RepID=A0A4Q7M4J8_9MICO|nr:hypothetical protein [Xylanibacterium ulmi]RZS62895.1 hypothetical protein EV386_3251 [Xylanibacterium ulmi]
MPKTAFVGLLALSLVGSPYPSDAALDGILDRSTKEVNVSAEDSAWESSGGGRNEKEQALPPEVYFRADVFYCALLDLDGAKVKQREPCGEGAVEWLIPAPCPEDSHKLAALWVQRLAEDGTYGPAQMVSPAQCVTAADLQAEARRELATLHVPTPNATLQTASPTLLVNAWYPAHTTATPITREATLLGVPVQVRAIPTQYTWDFDDPFSPTGPTLTTTDPGRAWTPGDGDVDHTWTAHAWTRLGDPDTPTGKNAETHRAANGAKYRTNVTITLTTTWQGQYRILGAPTWTTIPDTLTTTSPAGTYTLTEARTHLYCDTLNRHTTC